MDAELCDLVAHHWSMHGKATPLLGGGDECVIWKHRILRTYVAEGGPVRPSRHLVPLIRAALRHEVRETSVRHRGRPFKICRSCQNVVDL